ncbi:MAG: hypothetical protein ING90_20840 [Rhodocyclaceae bacterium]|nr:hypothetical protein [Rhodocyclaceae bacterium]
MNDWVNWSEYSEAVTPEAQRLSDEREKLRQQQRDQMIAASEKLKGEQALDIRTGGKGEITSLPGYAELTKQQEAGQGQWAAQQAKGWEALLTGQQDKPQESGWAGLNKRLTDIQAKGQLDVTKRDAEAKAKIERERKEGEERIKKQNEARIYDQQLQDYLSQITGGGRRGSVTPAQREKILAQFYALPPDEQRRRVAAFVIDRQKRPHVYKTKDIKFD